MRIGRHALGAFGARQVGPSCAVAASSLARHIATVPSKGVREAPPVPDRLKDAMAYFGNESQPHMVMEDTPFVPQDKRQNLLKETMAMQQNMRSTNKLDRLRVTLDGVRNKSSLDEAWNDVYLFMRTTELCTELVKISTDDFPRGKKLWIELEFCEERRVPYFLKMPNGMIVLPIFSFEEYQDHYFSKLDIFEAVWFPVPRMGSRYEAFCKMSFPVCALGPLVKHSALATVSIPASQFGILINPGHRSSKFVTYPEMVYLAKQKKHSMGNEGVMTFHDSLKKAFDTSKMPMVRLSPSDVVAHLKDRPAIPQVAQLELHLLLFPFTEVREVHVRTVPRPKWKKFLTGGTETITQLDVVVVDAADKDREWRIAVAQIMQSWSFMKEFHSDVHIEFCAAAPPSSSGSMKLYESAVDGKMLRGWAAHRGMTLRQSLDFDAPLVDADGNTVDTGPKKQA